MFLVIFLDFIFGVLVNFRIFVFLIFFVVIFEFSFGIVRLLLRFRCLVLGGDDFWFVSSFFVWWMYIWWGFLFFLEWIYLYKNIGIFFSGRVKYVWYLSNFEYNIFFRFKYYFLLDLYFLELFCFSGKKVYFLNILSFLGNYIIYD